MVMHVQMQDTMARTLESQRSVRRFPNINIVLCHDILERYMVLLVSARIHDRNMACDIGETDMSDWMFGMSRRQMLQLFQAHTSGE